MTALPDPRLDLRVIHRRYVPYSHAHYGGDLVDGAYVLGLFGDVATEVCIHTDGDEGLFAAYQEVTFHAPVRSGDVLEVSARLVRIGHRSRELELTAHVAARSRPEHGPSAASLVQPPLLAVSARGTVVVPPPGDTP
ncbi:MAG: 3-aminobutyryl-CoA ammonia lyase [Actinomycetes bacterium]